MKYYLLDKIVFFEKGLRARAIKCVTFSEEVLHDHFPDFPVMPGALLLEGAAQLASFLYEMSINSADDQPPRRSILVQVDKAKFYHFVEPGDQIVLEAELSHTTITSTKCKVDLTVAKKKVASMTLTLASRKIESENLHLQRRRIYKIWTRNLENKPEIF